MLLYYGIYISYILCHLYRDKGDMNEYNKVVLKPKGNMYTMKIRTITIISMILMKKQ